MALSEERVRLGEERKLIFQNFANLVPKEEIAVAFSRSVEEVGREIAFVAKKLREYRHRRCTKPNAQQGLLLPIECETDDDIIVNRDHLLRTLECIGPETLSTELIIPTLRTHKIDRPEYLYEASRRIGPVNVREVKAP